MGPRARTQQKINSKTVVENEIYRLNIIKKIIETLICFKNH